MKRVIDIFKLWLIELLLSNILWKAGRQNKNLTSSQAIDAILKEKVGRILLGEFAAILSIHRQLIGRIERILQSIRVSPYLLIHSVVAKCLLLIEVRSKARVEKLYELGALEQTFAGNFNHFLSELGFEDSLRNSQIRELYAAELFENIGDITLPLSISNETSHHANHMDMMFVVGIAKYRNAKNIFEFGTYLGRTTCGLASISDDATVHTLNLPPEADPRYGPYIGQLIKNSPHQHQIQQIFCDSRKFLTDSYTKRMDYIFIDADHSYDGVKNDTEKAFEMLAPGGMIIWHDYAPKSPGVYQYLYELSKQRSLFRIKKTCLVLHIDGVDVAAFLPAKIEVALEDS
jgi:predicted O-methyltransferase YrrM